MRKLVLHNFRTSLALNHLSKRGGRQGLFEREPKLEWIWSARESPLIWLVRFAPCIREFFGIRHKPKIFTWQKL